MVRLTIVALFATLLICSPAFGQGPAGADGEATLAKILTLETSGLSPKFNIDTKAKYKRGVNGSEATRLKVCATCNWGVYMNLDYPTGEIIGENKGKAMPLSNFEYKIIFVSGGYTELTNNELWWKGEDGSWQAFRDGTEDIITERVGQCNIGDNIKFRIRYRLGKNDDLGGLLAQKIPADTYKIWFEYVLQERSTL